MKTVLCVLALWGFSVSAAQAQSAKALESSLKGTPVLVKLDMPATSRGLEVRPDRPDPIGEKQYLQRIALGIALHAGETTWVSQVRVTSRAIEVHLGGGGFNLLMDEGATAALGRGVAQKTQEQMDLEREALPSTISPGDISDMTASNERLKQLERERLAGGAEAKALREGTASRSAVKSRAQRMGSRFVIKFPSAIPADKLTPAYVRHTLGEYLDFLATAETGAH